MWKTKLKINPKIKVTDVKEQRHRSDRRTIFLADGRVFGIPGDVFLAHPVHPGDLLEEKEIAELLEKSDRQQLKDSAFNLLSYRVRSRAELKRRLIEKGGTIAEIDSLLDYLESKGYLNDLEFARTFTRDKIKLKHLGPFAISAELMRFQVDKILIKQVVKEFYPEGAEAKLIGELLDKKNLSINESDKKQQKKIIDFLTRKGFAWEHIRTVLYERKLIK